MQVDSFDPIGYRLGGFLLVLLRLGPFSNMHFTLKLFFAFLIAGFTNPVSAEDARGTGLVLLLEPVGARAAAMAGALSSINDDFTALSTCSTQVVRRSAGRHPGDKRSLAA